VTRYPKPAGFAIPVTIPNHTQHQGIWRNGLQGLTRYNMPGTSMTQSTNKHNPIHRPGDNEDDSIQGHREITHDIHQPADHPMFPLNQHSSIVLSTLHNLNRKSIVNKEKEELPTM
jgi:hypothetical protein